MLLSLWQSTEGATLLLGVERRRELVRVHWCGLLYDDVSRRVCLSCHHRADDAHRGCHEAGESVPPEVEHDSQLAQGGRHVRPVLSFNDVGFCVSRVSERTVGFA